MLPTLMFGSLCARVRSFSVLWLIGLKEEKAKRLVCVWMMCLLVHAVDSWIFLCGGAAQGARFSDTRFSGVEVGSITRGLQESGELYVE
jgi:hypothetical protein